ncbi:MAG: hypothetical protein ABFS39_04390 [Pseudomonadota bacterium]
MAVGLVIYLVIILLPILRLLAFWLFCATRLRLRRRKRRLFELRRAPPLHQLQA